MSATDIRKLVNELQRLMEDERSVGVDIRRDEIQFDQPHGQLPAVAKDFERAKHRFEELPQDHPVRAQLSNTMDAIEKRIGDLMTSKANRRKFLSGAKTAMALAAQVSKIMNILDNVQPVKPSNELTPATLKMAYMDAEEDLGVAAQSLGMDIMTFAKKLSSVVSGKLKRKIEDRLSIAITTDLLKKHGFEIVGDDGNFVYAFNQKDVKMAMAARNYSEEQSFAVEVWADHGNLKTDWDYNANEIDEALARLATVDQDEDAIGEALYPEDPDEPFWYEGAEWQGK